MAASDMMSALMELCQEEHIDQLYLIDRLEIGRASCRERV